MFSCRKSLLLLSAFAALGLPLEGKQPIPPDHWVGTWASAPQSIENKDGYGTRDMTIRAMVHVSIAGPLTRVVLTNEFGTEPLIIGGAHIANAAQNDGISLVSANALTFSGRSSITIPAGGLAVSDPVALSLQPLSNVAVSIFLPAQMISHVSGHFSAEQTSYIAPGNLIGKASLSGGTAIHNWPFLKGLDTKVSGLHSAVVCLGDSITDGARSTADTNGRWPDILAKRLHSNGKTAKLSVLNEGIGGNRILRDGVGPAALARFDRDVIAQSGAKYLILLEGINDIGTAFTPKGPGYQLAADDLIAGAKQIAERAHTHGLLFFAATVTPYMGAGYFSPQGEAVRKAFNEWIRTSKDLDGFIDFDKATRDPANPDALSSSADSGDHLHPKDAGYKAMGEAIDLSLFSTKGKQKYDISRER